MVEHFEIHPEIVLFLDDLRFGAVAVVSATSLGVDVEREASPGAASISTSR